MVAPHTRQHVDFVHNFTRDMLESSSIVNQSIKIRVLKRMKQLQGTQTGADSKTPGT